MKNTSVSLGPHFEGYIADQVSSGLYSSASEVIRDALRQHEAEAKKKYDEWVKYVNAALEEGEASGIAEGFDWDELLKELNAEWDAKQQAK